MRYSWHVALFQAQRRSASARLYMVFLVIITCTMGAVAEELSERPVPTRFDAKFSLVDHNGKQVTQDDYHGHWLLVFFGYTNCPDVCPTTMVDISLILRRLGEDARHVQALFITVDPERDDVNTIANFVDAFGDKIVGLTGSTSAVRDAADSFRAHFRKDEEDRGPDAYLMEHQATIYLLDRRGELKTVFNPGFSPDRVVDILRQFIQDEAKHSSINFGKTRRNRANAD